MARDGDFGRGSRFIVLASICIVIGGLYFAQEVLIPLALAVLLSYLLTPLVNLLERLYLGRTVSVVVVVLLVLGLMGGLGWIIKSQFVQIAERLPNYRQHIYHKLISLRGTQQGIGEAAIKIVRTVQEATKVRSTHPTSGPVSPAKPKRVLPEGMQPQVPAHPPPDLPKRRAVEHPLSQITPQTPLPVREYPETPLPVQSALEVLSRILHPLATAGLVVVFVFFMLLYRSDLRDRVIRLASMGQINFTTQIMDEGTRRISYYLVAQSIMNGIFGLSTALGLWIIGRALGAEQGGFPNVLLWGLLCGVLRFIPYVGVWMGAAFPMALAFGIFPGNGVFLATVLMFIGLEILISQFIEPLLYGSVTGVSTMAILVSAIFWTSVWGPIGLLLSTPLTVVLVVIGKYVPQVHFLNVLFGDEPVLEPHERIYQRLLAQDPEEALEIAQECLTTMSLERLYDEVLLTAVVLSAHDYHRGKLPNDRLLAVYQGLCDVIEELGEMAEKKPEVINEKREDEVEAKPQPQAPVKKPAGAVKVMCLPVRNEADVVVCLMLKQLLDYRGFDATIGPIEGLANEKAATVDVESAQVVCVSAVGPNVVTRTRYLCRRLMDRDNRTRLIVGLWQFKGNLSRIKKRFDFIAGGGNRYLTGGGTTPTRPYYLINER